MGSIRKAVSLAALSEIAPSLACPRCRSAVVAGERYRCTNPACSYAQRGFSVAGAHPVLIDAENSVVDVDHLPDAETGVTKAMSPKRRIGIALYAAVGRRNRVAERCAQWLLTHLTGGGASGTTVLVVGGGSIGSGMAALYDDPRVRVAAFDIFPSRHVHLVADAHAIPFADASVDAVVIQAVLHTLLDPQRAVSEIHRVLKPDGIVFADSPFLQPVVDAAYDFTRFTESGHRWLFRDFERIDCGMVAGVGEVFASSFDYVVRALLRSSAAGRLARIPALLLGRAIDAMTSEQYALDGASSVFFLGRKSDRRVTAREIVEHYHGAQR
jgi:SAM-dependent methyltransferase